ncbi:hypothetical protein [Oricola indica]|uniref:hypothetical protein n=1 Tax=Oricola indica TaxID=2872591 RepID=UPI003CCBD2A9
MWKWILALLCLLGAGYASYVYFMGGFHTMPILPERSFPLSYKSGFRAILVGMDDERAYRKYLAYSANDVPSWYKESWSVCRAPTEEEQRQLENAINIGPGGRWDAVCEISADGDIFVRGWIASVPKL